MPQLLTAEQFAALPDDAPRELVRGKVVSLTRPGHQRCRLLARIAHSLLCYLDKSDEGTVVCGFSGIITHRNPDTVLGPDVAYYSYGRLAKGEDPPAFPCVSPELVFETKSAGLTWAKTYSRICDFLDADVKLVCLLEPKTKTCQIFGADNAPRTYAHHDEICFSPVLPNWHLKVSQFFAE